MFPAGIRITTANSHHWVSPVPAAFTLDCRRKGMDAEDESPPQIVALSPPKPGWKLSHAVLSSLQCLSNMVGKEWKQES